MSEWDVVVVGTGAAGLCAAIEASDAGKRVLLVESEETAGGSSLISGGMIMAAGTELQSEQGIDDSADAFYHDYLMHTQWKVIPALAKKIAQDSAAAISWLSGKGVRFYDELNDAGYDGVPRTHAAIGRGAGIIEPLLGEVESRGIEIRLRSRVTRLTTDRERVTGVDTTTGEYRAQSVILATGGFGANPERVRELMPHTASAGDWLWYIGAEGARGDALDLAEQVDAQITGHGRGVSMLTPDFVRQFEGYQPGWLVLVNKHGKRFVDETLPYGLMDGVVQAQPDAVVYAIFDDAAKNAVAPGDPAAYRLQIASLPDRPSPNWDREMIDRQIAAGKVQRAESLELLAELLGLPAAALAGTARRYNDSVDRGADLDFGKPGKFLRPLASGPFYGVELRLATICLTSTGLQTDDEGRVLGTSGSPIEGLFAAGECTGGTLGDRYVGTGNSWINCVVFGRAAGKAAAEPVS